MAAALVPLYGGVTADRMLGYLYTFAEHFNALAPPPTDDEPTSPAAGDLRGMTGCQTDVERAQPRSSSSGLFVTPPQGGPPL